MTKPTSFLSTALGDLRAWRRRLDVLTDRVRQEDEEVRRRLRPTLQEFQDRLEHTRVKVMRLRRMEEGWIVARREVEKASRNLEIAWTVALHKLQDRARRGAGRTGSGEEGR